MQSFMNILLFLGLLALASASPAKIQKRGVYKVERVKNAAFSGHNGPRALAKAYRKYSMPLPPALLESMRGSASTVSAAETNVDAESVSTKATSGKKNKGNGATSTTTSATGATGKKKGKGNGAGATTAANNATAGAVTAAANGTAGTGNVAATPENGDVEYLAPVTIGGQTLNLDFDSGSSDLWVFNTQLKTASSTGHTLFDPSKSTSFALNQGQTFSISYGDGSGAAGNVGTDTVNIGGATVTSQAIELATAVSQSFVQDQNSQGLLGLAFSKLNTVQPQQQKTFFDNVMSSLAEPVFTADLRQNAVGAYEFGTIDQTKFTGQMSWIAVNTTQGFWQFSSEKFAVGTGAAQTAQAGGQAIADTGTTLMIAAQATVDGYYSQVQGAQNDDTVGGFVFPCDAQLPDLMIDVGGVMAKVKGADINFTAVQDNTCFGGLQATTSDLQIFGDIFFKSQFVAFNGGNNSLGIADHAF